MNEEDSIPHIKKRMAELLKAKSPSEFQGYTFLEKKLADEYKRLQEEKDELRAKLGKIGVR